MALAGQLCSFSSRLQQMLEIDPEDVPQFDDDHQKFVVQTLQEAVAQLADIFTASEDQELDRRLNEVQSLLLPGLQSSILCQRRNLQAKVRELFALDLAQDFNLLQAKFQALSRDIELIDVDSEISRNFDVLARLLQYRDHFRNIFNKDSHQEVEDAIDAMHHAVIAGILPSTSSIYQSYRKMKIEKIKDLQDIIDREKFHQQERSEHQMQMKQQQDLFHRQQAGFQQAQSLSNQVIAARITQTIDLSRTGRELNQRLSAALQELETSRQSLHQSEERVKVLQKQLDESEDRLKKTRGVPKDMLVSDEGLDVVKEAVSQPGRLQTDQHIPEDSTSAPSLSKIWKVSADLKMSHDPRRPVSRRPTPDEYEAMKQRRNKSIAVEVPAAESSSPNAPEPQSSPPQTPPPPPQQQTQDQQQLKEQHQVQQQSPSRQEQEEAQKQQQDEQRRLHQERKRMMQEKIAAARQKIFLEEDKAEERRRQQTKARLNAFDAPPGSSSGSRD